VRDAAIPPLGTLTERVQLQRRETESEDEGGQVAVFTTLATVWARVRRLSARQAFESDARGQDVTHSVVFRFRSDLKPGDRIVYRGNVLVAALRADEELTALVGEDGVFDAPPAERLPPYVTIARHDVLPRDGDDAPGFEHRVLLHAWAGEASRKAVVMMVERIVSVAETAELDGALTVTLRRHKRTDTAIDAKTGRARAAVAMSFFTEEN
jgi:SPP1 family predicted phage head-tail adaptor